MSQSSEADRGGAQAGNVSTTFDQFVGMRFDDHESGMPRTGHLIIEAHHCNPTGAINGGVILSLADKPGDRRRRRGVFREDRRAGVHGRRGPVRIDALEPAGRIDRRESARCPGRPTCHRDPNDGHRGRRQAARRDHRDPRSRTRRKSEIEVSDEVETVSEPRTSNALLGIINFAKPRSEGVGLDPSGKGLAPGGEFMESRARGSKTGLANLDHREMKIYDARPDLETLDIDTQGFCVG